MITVLIPAHNEEAQIARTIASLRRQTREPERIVVISDNSADDTVLQARAAGAETMETVGNTAKKAGALNQALRKILPEMDGEDIVLIQDADSALSNTFIETALRHLQESPDLGAVGGVFSGGPGGGFVGHLQRNEYARYARDVARLDGKCLVVTGTAAMLRVRTLRHVSDARRVGAIPVGDGSGGIYDTTVLTEDNELTFALLHLGYKVKSPPECFLVTEVMETWRDLWQQRLRWKRGAVENCLQYGLTHVTWRYWGRQLLTAVGVVVTAAYLSSLVWSLVVLGSINIQPFWLAVTGIFIMERIITIRYRGWKHMLAAATMYELTIDLFLQVVHAKAYTDALTGKTRSW